MRGKTLTLLGSLGRVNPNHWTKSNSCYDQQSIGQSVLVSSSHLRQRPDFYYCQTFAGLLICGAHSEMRAGLSHLLLTLTTKITLHSKFNVYRFAFISSSCRRYSIFGFMHYSTWRLDSISRRSSV
jgi:hypothetical protein